MTATNPLLAYALRARELGFAPCPPTSDGSKRPRATSIPLDCEHPDCVKKRGAGKTHGWIHWTHAFPTVEDDSRYYVNGEKGFGTSCGGRVPSKLNT